MFTGKWVKNTGRFSSGEFYQIGKINVGGWFFNPTVSRDSPTVYRATVTLPGIVMKEGTTDFRTAEQARERVEKAVRMWFQWLERE